MEYFVQKHDCLTEGKKKKKSISIQQPIQNNKLNIKYQLNIHFVPKENLKKKKVHQ